MRFPNIAAETYKRVEDFDVRKANLSIFGLDHRDVIALEAFTKCMPNALQNLLQKWN